MEAFGGLSSKDTGGQISAIYLYDHKIFSSYIPALFNSWFVALSFIDTQNLFTLTFLIHDFSYCFQNIYVGSKTYFITLLKRNEDKLNFSPLLTIQNQDSLNKIINYYLICLVCFQVLLILFLNEKN